MIIAGGWSGHDCSFCILEDGVPILHAEYERYIREKEPPGDSLKFLYDIYKDYSDIKDKGRITRSEYINICDSKISPRTALNDLQKMVKMKIIVLKGKKKAAYYIIKS